MADQRYAADTTAPGCDYLVRLPAGRTPRILQLTDMQVIDATQQRYSGRLNEKEIVGRRKTRTPNATGTSAVWLRRRTRILFS